MAELTLDWTLRQPKDAPWCWDALLIYPCGCAQEDWSGEDTETCNECYPFQRHLEARDRTARHMQGRPSDLFLAHQRYIDRSRFSLLGPLGKLGQVLHDIYVPALIEQLNQPLVLQ